MITSAFGKLQLSEDLHVNGKIIIDNDIELQGDLRVKNNVYLPVGTIIQYAGANAPGGWLLCNGQFVSKVTYSALFEVIQNLYGSSPNVGTFQIPDFSGRVPVGPASGNGFNLADKYGSSNHTLTVNEMPTHSHTATSDVEAGHIHHYQDAYFAENRGLGGGKFGTSAGTDGDNDFIWRTPGGSFSNIPANIETSIAGGHNHSINVNSSGGGNSFSIMQPHLVIHYLIKY